MDSRAALPRHRRRLRARCARCRLHVPLCICAALPRADGEIRVVLVPHPIEWRQPSNTGRIAVLVLRRAELAVRYDAFDPTLLLRADHDHVLLHPSSGAPPLASSGRPTTLIVPDGTWKQSTRIANRLLRELPGLRRARLDVPPRHDTDLRAAPSPDRIGTGEAIAHALAILGDRAAAGALRDGLHLMKQRTLWTRGALSNDEANIPLEARRAMTR